MDAIIVTGGTPEKIAALVLAVQGRQGTDETRETASPNERELLIQRCERELVLLKSGESPRSDDQEQLIRAYERRLEELKSGALP